MKYLTKSEADTKNLGKTFGEKLKGGEVFLLSGDLGGGKTQFVKGLAEGLLIPENLTSPTFTFESIYPGRGDLVLYHFDLYRSEKLDNDLRLMIEEAMDDINGVVAIEWAERASEIWPKHYSHLKFDWVNENTREITINSK